MLIYDKIIKMEAKDTYLLIKNLETQLISLGVSLFLYVHVSSEFLAYSIILISLAVKPMNDTRDIGLFFVFIHILV